MVNEFRFQLARDKEPGEANSDQTEAVINTGSGNLSIGRNNFSPRETTIKRVQFIDNVSYVSGRNNYKFGLDFNFDRIFNFFPGIFSGSYTFPSYTAFANRTPSAYTQNFAGANTTGATTNPNLSEYAFFGQDDVRVTPKLTLNLGLRYDYASMACPQVQNTDTLLPAIALTPLVARKTRTTSRRASASLTRQTSGQSYAAASASSTVARRPSCSARCIRRTASTSRAST